MILKMLSTKDKEKILKLSREKSTLHTINKDKEYIRHLDRRNFACQMKIQ